MPTVFCRSPRFRVLPHALAAAAMAAAGGGATAQQAAAAEAGKLSVITVTAERRTENIREVPSAITAWKRAAECVWPAWNCGRINLTWTIATNLGPARVSSTHQPASVWGYATMMTMWGKWPRLPSRPRQRVTPKL